MVGFPRPGRPGSGRENPSNERSGVDRENAASTPKGRGGGGACPGLPSGATKGPRARLVTGSQLPGHLGKPRWLVWFVVTTLPMRFYHILFIMLAMTRVVHAQEMSPEWCAAKDASWARTRAEFPESASDGPFKRRMLENDEWAKQHDHNLYYDANKPWRLATLVQAEMEVAANNRERDLARSSHSPQGQPQCPPQLTRHGSANRKI